MNKIGNFLILTTYPLCLASFFHLFIEFTLENVLAFFLFLIFSFCINLLNVEYLNLKNRKHLFKKLQNLNLKNLCRLEPNEKIQKIFSVFETSNLTASARRFRKADDKILLPFFGVSAKWLYVIKQSDENTVFASAEAYVFPDAPDFIFINDYPTNVFREYDLIHEICHTSVASIFVNHFYSQQFIQWLLLLIFSTFLSTWSYAPLICGLFVLIYPLMFIFGYWENDIELVTDYNTYLMMTLNGHSLRDLIPIKRFHERKYEALLEAVENKPVFKHFFLLNYAAMRQNLVKMIVDGKVDLTKTKSYAVLLRSKLTFILKVIAIGYVAIHLNYRVDALLAVLGFVIAFFFYYFGLSFKIHVATHKRIISLVTETPSCNQS